MKCFIFRSDVLPISLLRHSLRYGDLVVLFFFIHRKQSDCRSRRRLYSFLMRLGFEFILIRSSSRLI